MNLSRARSPALSSALLARVLPSRFNTPAEAAGIAVSVIEARLSSSGSVNRLVKSLAAKLSVVSSFVDVDQPLTVGAVLPTRTAMLREADTV